MIKLIREAKTAADERDIVAKECADIRTSFKKEENSVRARNICKLIYVNLLGYATHFAQMDCLKLIVSNSYSDKRVGYLGLMMLLDERQEVLMLVTNSLKKYVNLILITQAQSVHFVENTNWLNFSSTLLGLQ
jgi:AP-1 complex subunit gamma-1